MTNDDHPLLFALSFVCALGSGVIAGVFFAFSTFVMKALQRLPASQGMAAMQSISVAVLNPWFLCVFLGTALASVALVISEFFIPSFPGQHFASIGAAFYLLGTFTVTAICHIPRNDALAKLDPANPTSAVAWSDYLTQWTIWNHVRTVAAWVSCALMIVAMCMVR